MCLKLKKSGPNYRSQNWVPVNSQVQKFSLSVYNHFVCIDWIIEVKISSACKFTNTKVFLKYNHFVCKKFKNIYYESTN